ncbi:4307be2c-d19c-4148-a90c-d2ac654b26b5 [Thermothielavioides terrestris]|uniref:Protein kinase domain-containing protein n=2 Tax=Thermothielavioides terrestris TaxID=2587410 RepID=G2QVB9_THETT|nr:uncharacterized protein THITE_2109407 [Thermothielavioides terrestris NRRL 8126]AEO63806.1 hypothetical protein THITE_2109407 [Thermothielavioides terrestris NRRL 8126]SPQ23468.1 4307be2c-d19c-4148-a90c-d2ac654b26b5 [Thermothielavioides terrestris]
MEPNRIWHDPVVEIFSNLITPTVCYSAEAYDLANRRWYRLDVTEAEVPDDDWLAETVASHVRAYYDAHQQVPPWNTINMTARDSAASYEIRADDLVSRPITKFLSYGTEPTDKLPTTSVDELKQLTYISRSADRCVWRGRDCVFKRIEFDVDIMPIAQEIRAREALIEAIGPVGSDADLNVEMTNRFSVVPILAVVIGNRQPWKPGTVAGFLMPFCGSDLEILTRNPADELPITEAQLRGLVRGVRELGRCGVKHGDIRFWNTVLQPGEGSQEARLLLIDLGSVAPDYDGDAKALGTLLLWCVARACSLKADGAAKARVVAAAAALRADEDFDTALACLSGESRSANTNTKA